MKKYYCDVHAKMDESIYRACPSFSGYAASRDGRVWNMKRGYEMGQREQSLGYMIVFVQIGKRDFHDNYKIRGLRGVHRLVIDAWVGPEPEGKEVHHIDHDKKNNRIENLMYVTRAENLKYAREAKRWPDMKGRKSPRFGSKASPETKEKMRQAKLGDRHWRAVRPDVDRLLLLRGQGYSRGEIAAEMGLRETTVGEVLRGTHWSVAGRKMPPMVRVGQGKWRARVKASNSDELAGATAEAAGNANVGTGG